MVEKFLRRRDRERIEAYARERWESRLRQGEMSGRVATLVQEDVFRYLKRNRVGGTLFGAILLKIAMVFAAALIRKWLENWMVSNGKR